MSCSDLPEPLKRMRAKARAGTLRFEYGGRDEEMAYLRDAIAKEPDPSTRARMRERLEYVESKTDEQLHQEMTGRQRPS